MPLAIDYSDARPSPAAIKAAGYSDVLRYVPTGFAGKDVSLPEIQEIHAAGLGIGFIWETTAQRATAGSPAGQEDGNICKSQLEKLKVSRGSPVFVNVGDFAATPDELNAIVGYYYQFRFALGSDTIFRCGAYATSYLIAHMVAQGQTGIWWQNAIDDQGISGSVVNTHASMYQRTSPTKSIAGSKPGDYDEDAFGFGPVPDIPFWKPSVSPSPAPAPVPVPAPSPKVIKTVTVTYNDGTSEVIQ